MTDPATVHPMRAAIRNGSFTAWLCLALSGLLPILGLHGSDELALAVAGLFLTTPNRWEHQ